MSSRAAICLAITALLTPVAAYSADGPNPSSPQKQAAQDVAQDAAITSRIKAEFAKDQRVDSTEIKVDTDNGVVTLTGHARSKEEADRAVSIAQSARGVVEVKNMMQVSVLEKR
jgi:osmotically-inducible protein OsmY